MAKHRVITGIDLFAGAGGLSLGAKLAGIRVQLAIDSDPLSLTTYHTNLHEVTALASEVAKFPFKSLPQLKRPLIVFGGPPCQGYSTSNQKTRSRENPSNWLFLDAIFFAKVLRPECVVLENVAGMKEIEGGLFLSEALRALENIGYATSWWKLNAADFGVPQRRSRLFIIGSRSQNNIPPPQPTHNVLGYVTVSDAISDLPALSSGASTSLMPYRCPPPSAYAANLRCGLSHCENNLVTRNSPLVLKRYRHVPPGGNWMSIPARLMRNYANRERCHTGIYSRLSNEEPAKVIGNYRKNMIIHPTQDRGLSVREAARLQSFPDSYVFCGSIGFQQQQVGNAVPPLLARAVFEHLLAVI